MAATTMQLEFEQAMSDFKTMFPDMDVEVIEVILRSNKGAVDATIDQLLAMSTDNQVSEMLAAYLQGVVSEEFLVCFPCHHPQNEKLRNEMDHRGGGGGAKRDCSTNSHKVSSSPINAPQSESRSRQESNSLLSISPALVSYGSPASNGGASPKTTLNYHGATNGNASRWKPPLLGPLPPSFLRINGGGGVPGGPRGANSELELPDEQFALMLQNEEFMNELRWNQVSPRRASSGNIRLTKCIFDSRNSCWL